MWRPLSNDPDPNFHYDRVVLVLLATLLALSTPVVAWWSRDGSAWYLPYLIWLGIIAMIALALRGFRVEPEPDSENPDDASPQ
ncbi:MAG: UTP--glucose-1-phosphate uridylyltransferase [Gammaproteobacteria bacterium]|nr:UTP--glucose-1-phosphate uridylyltransferase [Gammaproteobacteria bacterium]MCP5135479.1 UTP--glucose-1-phosphate uridylyltransferase [Gammaproteobacteria bacterium]